MKRIVWCNSCQKPQSKSFGVFECEFCGSKFLEIDDEPAPPDTSDNEVESVDP